MVMFFFVWFVFFFSPRYNCSTVYFLESFMFQNKLNKNAAGVCSEEHRSGAPSRCTPDPITGDAYLSGLAIFPARKKGVASAIPFGPLGPGFAKIAAGAVQLPRLSLPSQRYWCWIRRRGDPCGRPQAFPLPGGRWLAARPDG